MAVDTRDLGNDASRKIPDVKETAAAGEKYFGAMWWEKSRGFQWGGTQVEGRHEQIWIRGMRRNMMEEQG